MDRFLDIEIEHDLEILAGDGSALQLGQVSAHCVEQREDAEERAGLMGQLQHQAGAVGAGINFGFVGNADKTGMVVSIVLSRAY